MRERIDSTESNDLVCLRSEVDSAESSQMLADYLAKVIKSGLERVENYRDRVELANRVLEKAGLLEEGIKIVDSERGTVFHRQSTDQKEKEVYDYGSKKRQFIH